MPYIKWNNSRTAYTVWHGPSLGIAAMTAQGYEKVDILPAVTPEEVPLTDLIFSKYKVVQKLMELGLWENIKAGLTDTQMDFLYLAQDFRIEDPNFNAIYLQLKPNIPNVDALLRECVLEL